MVRNTPVKTVIMMHKTRDMFAPFGEPLEFESGSQKLTVSRGVWSYVFEAVLEYCRISFDLFLDSRPFSLLSVDSEEKIISLWYEEEQSLQAVWNALSADCGDKTFVDYGSPILPGLESCLNVLHMPTPYQVRVPNSTNVGLVYVIGTGIKDKLDKWLPSLIKQVEEQPQEQGYLPIDKSEWIFIDVVSGNSLEDIEETELFANQAVRALLYRVSMLNPRSVYRGLMRLAERKLGLASTTVMDIPMREETTVGQNASVMYGVEMLHDAAAHRRMRDLGLAEHLYLRLEGEDLREPDSGFSKTLGIKWVTPKANDMQNDRYTVEAHRLTMASVNNRSSICLSQFVLSGKSVALVYLSPEDSSPKEAFLLVAHGSVLYLHVLGTLALYSNPPILPVLPQSLQEESLGGELRVKDFVERFLLRSRLAPAAAAEDNSILPKVRAQQLVEQATRYWPLRSDATLIGGSTLAMPLFDHLWKDFLEDTESSACESAIDAILVNIKSQSSVRDTGPNSLPCSQAVATAVELDFFLDQFSDISADHGKVVASFKQKADGAMIGIKRLSKLISQAKSLLVSGKAIPGSPLSRLTEVQRLLKTQTLDGSAPGSQTAQNRNVNASARPVHYVYSIGSAEAFLQNLISVSRRPTGRNRPEFAGVLAAGPNPKGPLRLYANLNSGGGGDGS